MSSQSSLYNPTERTLAATGDGFSVPRLTTAGRTSIALTPSDKGMMVYDTTIGALCLWNGTAWEFINDSSDTFPSLVDFGGVGDGVTDNTAAMNAAVAYLDGLGGGILFIPPGTWLMNWVCTSKNITILGSGGKGEYNLSVIRPFSLATPPITYGDYTDNNSTSTRYSKLINCHVSGCNSGNYALSANNAPNALLLKGNSISLVFRDCVFYGGLKTVGMVTTNGVGSGPVTNICFDSCIIRNDITDSANSRGIYAVRSDVVGSGYYTDNKFISTKLNMGAGNLGYAAEMDGTLKYMQLEVFFSYWDIRPGLGLLLKDASVNCLDFQLDPGTTGVVIIESNQPSADPARIISGHLNNGGQKYKSLTTTVTLPGEGTMMAYQARWLNTFLSDTTYLTSQSDPFNITRYWDFQTNSGPLRLFGLDLYVKNTTQAASLTQAAIATDGGIACVKSARIGDTILVYGGNSFFSGEITAIGPAGGLYLGAAGVNQSIKLLPTGTGYVGINTGNLIPLTDNTQSCGQAGARWSEVWAGNGTIQTSDQDYKEQIQDIEPAVLRAWSKVKLSQYKFKDAVAKKGDGARWHFGVIAQRLKEAFESEGLDAFKYGLLCYDKWDDLYEDLKDEEGNFNGEKKLLIKAGESFGVRYDEVLALECAYLRSKLNA